MSYVYTTTKTKVEARSVSRCVVGVPDAASARDGFDSGVALVAGVEFAREWGNRPANHATPSLLADAAKTLAKLPRIQCKVHGPAEVARQPFAQTAVIDKDQRRTSLLNLFCEAVVHFIPVFPAHHRA